LASFLSRQLAFENATQREERLRERESKVNILVLIDERGTEPNKTKEKAALASSNTIFPLLILLSRRNCFPSKKNEESVPLSCSPISR
jgi:hypothetical protein